MIYGSNISVSFGGVHALKNCKFTIEEDITSIIGPNGAGKTTLFNTITGHVTPDTGTIMSKDEDITHTPPYRIVRQGIARTFQEPHVFDNLSLRENILVSRHNTISFDKRMKEEVSDILHRVGLAKPVDMQAGELSHGQKRLLEVARALALDNDILLLDEPTAGVHPDLVDTFKDIITSLPDDGVSVCLIEHDMDFVMDISEEILVLKTGSVLATGTPEEIRKDEAVLEAYLGP